MKNLILKSYQKLGLKLREILFSFSCLRRNKNNKYKFNLSEQKNVYILTTKHCLYIASLIENGLNLKLFSKDLRMVLEKGFTLLFVLKCLVFYQNIM